MSQVITGYLPSLIFQLFLFIVPPIMLLLSSMQGFISHSQIEKSACIKLLIFTVWNSFFANALSGSALYRVNVFLEPKTIPRVLAAAVPAQVRNTKSSFEVCTISFSDHESCLIIGAGIVFCILCCDLWMDWFIIRDPPFGSSSLEFYSENFRQGR